MRKGWFAVIMLAAMLTAVLLNIRHLDRMMTGLGDTVRLSRQYCEAGDYDSASRLVSDAAQTWDDASEYTYVTIRHVEIDALSDAFYELLGQLRAGEGRSASGGYEKLLYHIECIAKMEHLSFGSIF